MKDRFMLQLNKLTYAKLLEITDEPGNLAHNTVIKYAIENSNHDGNYSKLGRRDPMAKSVNIPREFIIILNRLRKNEGLNRFLNRIILNTLFQIELSERIKSYDYYTLFLQKEVYQKLDELGLTRFAARRLFIKFLKTKYGFECLDFERKSSIKSIVHNSFVLRHEMKDFVDGIRGNRSISDYCNHVILSVVNKYEKRKISELKVKEKI